MALNKKQQKFVEEYLQCWNATKAATAAGYSANSARQQGSRLLTNADIDAEIRDRLAELQVSTNEALTILATHARANIRKFMRVKDSGAVDFNFTNATEDDWRTVKAIEISPGEFGTRIRVEMYDAQSAITTILKQHQLANREATDIIQLVINGVVDASDTNYAA